jgi:hypothetical protein
LEEYAITNGFNPLKPEKWYSQVDKIQTMKVNLPPLILLTYLFYQGIFKILHHHDHSVAKALMNLFPEVAFDRRKFSKRMYRCLVNFILFNIIKIAWVKAKEEEDTNADKIKPTEQGTNSSYPLVDVNTLHKFCGT